MYNNVDAGSVSTPEHLKKGTSKQDNPFVPDEREGYQITEYDPSQYETDTDKRYSSGSSMPSTIPTDPSRQMRHVNEIEYETAMAPLDDLSYGNDSSSANGSLPSSTYSITGPYSTFKSSGSTQQLVHTPHHTPKSTINKRPAVSFIDSQDVNMYNKQVIIFTICLYLLSNKGYSNVIFQVPSPASIPEGI